MPISSTVPFTLAPPWNGATSVGLTRGDPDLTNSAVLYNPPTVQIGGHNGVWSEKVDNLSPGLDAISVDSSSSTAQIEVPWSQRSAIMFRVLGYSYVQGTHLKRVLPLVHPFWEFMRCRRVARAQGVRHSGDGPQMPVDLGPSFDRPYYANYDKIRLDLVYETLPFAFKTDAEVTHEYERYCYVRTEPGYDSYFVDGDTFKYDSIGQFAGLPNGVNAFATGRNYPVAVGQVLCTWYDVPLDYVQYQGIYKNIAFAIGKINSVAIFGYPKFTLLCDTPQIELRPNPLPPEITTDVTYLANITFRFHYFDPRPLGTGVTLSLGHNMGLYRGTRTWFPVSLGVAGAGASSLSFTPDNTTRVYESFDMGKMFDKPDGTTLTAGPSS